MSDTEIPLRCQMLIVAKKADDTEAMQAVEAVDGTLVLSGGIGCGKTVAACSWLLKRAPGLFLSSARLARWPRYEDAQMRRLLSASRLVIDDLGAEYMDEKGNFAAVLDEVIVDRHANMKPTVITTNLDATAFKNRYGQRIADRVRECGRFLSLADVSKRPHADWAEIQVAYDAEMVRRRDEELKEKQRSAWAPERNATAEELEKLRGHSRRLVAGLAESKDASQVLGK